MGKEMAMMPADYGQWLADIKNRVLTARQRAALAVNAELVSLYWHIGRDILQRQAAQGWGSKVIERLGRDLREAWTDFEIVQQVAAQLPWFHLCTLIDKVKDTQQREWYLKQAIVQGWSRTTLEIHIKNCLHERQGQAVTNFAARLPAPTSALAQD